MTLLVIGLALFIGSHLVGVIGLRERLLERLGEGPYKGVYSLLSIVGLVLIVVGWRQAGEAPQVVWLPPVAMKHVALLVMLPVFPLLAAAYMPGRIKQALGHPMLVATILWALAHMLANGMLRDVAVFGGLLVWAVIDLASYRWRPRREIPGMPLGKLNDVLAVVVGLVLYAVTLLWLHGLLFGVAPIAL